MRDGVHEVRILFFKISDPIGSDSQLRNKYMTQVQMQQHLISHIASTSKQDIRLIE